MMSTYGSPCYIGRLLKEKHAVGSIFIHVHCLMLKLFDKEISYKISF
jgi:hypothetical protein